VSMNALMVAVVAGLVFNYGSVLTKPENLEERDELISSHSLGHRVHVSFCTS
jgi:hypothetical protein